MIGELTPVLRGWGNYFAVENWLAVTCGAWELTKPVLYSTQYNIREK